MNNFLDLTLQISLAMAMAMSSFFCLGFSLAYLAEVFREFVKDKIAKSKRDNE